MSRNPSQAHCFSKANKRDADSSYIHFYEHDYNFEQLWRSPYQQLPKIQAYGGALGPDPSVYREMPLSQQIQSVYKSRVLGYWLAKEGVNLIPNVRWGDERTFAFCFDGLPRDSVLAIGTHGCVKHLDDRRYFINGLLEMLERLRPKALVVYGSISEKLFPPIFVNGTDIIPFESDFSLSRKKEEVRYGWR